ncbi:cell wall hydrolase SleB [Paenibacillus curdlanolyticus YK9]|uniref:Cell wall hydrolase SleB n=1 Tax=Paenibacillus curdlanolyticus YK9 TaxID=717606 RepID=E0IE38_9BACL|nr:cell wall hydrolase [Paenibacillus curdlanolyticus]EFM09392.1 cell wall hydrolase SleB [Paenibacillus curdlanolyticus YK9]
MFKKLGLYAAAIVLLSWIIIPQAQAEASNTFVTMSVGSKGPQVVDLQQRLRMLGYLSSEADGNYGEGTKDAVQRFQKGAAIAQTGVVGQTTMHALKKVTVSRTDLSMLARIVYSEARGEQYDGQVAIAAVVLNRVASNDFPDTIEEVIFAPGAFHTIDSGTYWLEPDAEAFRAAIDAAKGIDPTNGGLYFNGVSAKQNDWFKSRTVTATIGGHIFVK